MGIGRILVVEDDESLRRVTQAQLEKCGYETAVACDVPEALEKLESEPRDLIITDLNLPGASGLELLKQVRLDYPETTVVVVTAYGTIETAVEAMKSGAYDYITKPVHPDELRAVVNRVLERRQLIEEVRVLRSSLDQKYGFENIIGRSSALLQVLDSASRVAHTDATVLILGETGTGKELLAKAIHFNSLRRERPFVVINCGAIPAELLESELFGHVKGSFTGAMTHKKGKVEMAEGGTLFLDEVGEMSLDLQKRVLRLLQEREIEKVGATKLIRVDVRIIAATHRNLETLVAEGKFREDLYYRLAVIPIVLPPLRDRAGDIPELIQQFFDRSRQKHNRPDLALSPAAMPLPGELPVARQRSRTGERYRAPGALVPFRRSRRRGSSRQHPAAPDISRTCCSRSRDHRGWTERSRARADREGIASGQLESDEGRATTGDQPKDAALQDGQVRHHKERGRRNDAGRRRRRGLIAERQKRPARRDNHFQ